MKSAKIFLMITVASVILSAGGSQALALTGYGRISASTGVTQAFDRFQLNSNITYYFCGSEANPDAIIGIDKGYALVSDLWHKIEVTPKMFQSLVSSMQIGHGNLLGANLHGFAISDDKGQQIGVWYSPLGVGSSSFVKMLGEKRVHVQTVGGADHGSSSR